MKSILWYVGRPLAPIICYFHITAEIRADDIAVDADAFGFHPLYDTDTLESDLVQ